MTDANTPWLAEFNVESILTVRDAAQRLHYKHPAGLYEAFVANRAEATDKARLSVHILLHAANLDEAERNTRSSAEQFLHLLSFVCGTPFRIAGRVHVMDWSPGVAMRESIIYSPETSYDDTFAELNDSLLQTVGLVHSWGSNPQLDRALRWFAGGVRAKYIEDQFQYFWFVLELIAGTMTGPLVADKCQTCRSDLLCPTCNKVSMHRPFPRQRIEEICRRGGVKEDDISLLFKIRNALLHGSERDDIDKMVGAVKPGEDLASGVDFIGRLARDAILNSFTINEKPPAKPHFLNPSTFVSTTVTAGGHCQLGMMGDPNNPKIEDIRLPKVTITLDPRSGDANS